MGRDPLPETLRSRLPRSPYWRRGMEPNAPFVALAETNTGQVIVPCASNREHAALVFGKWRALNGQASDVGKVVVGAAVVSPSGEMLQEWKLDGPLGTTPVPGGPGRWTPLMRVSDWATCAGCWNPRWPGCWMSLTLSGCVHCLPLTEDDDPRPWPYDPAEPRIVAKPEKKKANRKTPETEVVTTPEDVAPGRRRKLVSVGTISPDQTRL